MSPLSIVSINILWSLNSSVLGSRGRAAKKKKKQNKYTPELLSKRVSCSAGVVFTNWEVLLAGIGKPLALPQKSVNKTPSFSCCRSWQAQKTARPSPGIVYSPLLFCDEWNGGFIPLGPGFNSLLVLFLLQLSLENLICYCKWNVLSKTNKAKTKTPNMP